VPSATYILFRNAILAEQQVVCSYDGRLREPARTSSAPTRMAKRSSLPGSSPARALAGCRNGAACGSPMCAMPACATARGRLASHRADLRQCDRSRC